MTEWIFPSANFAENGYSFGQGYDVAPPSKRSSFVSAPLSSQRELVELLQVEPLFDYLVQNGVLGQQDAADLKEQTSSAKANLTLLQRLEGTGNNGHLGLFVNALRQTGQHYLANLLDDGNHISPAGNTLSSTEDGTVTRHKGEVGVGIVVKAVQLGKDEPWVSVSELEKQIAKLLVPVPPSPTPPPPTDSFQLEEPEIPKPKQKCCLCSCFSALFSRKSKNQANSGGRKKKKNDRSQVYEQEQTHTLSTTGQQVTNKNHSHITSTNHIVSSNGGTVISTSVNTCTSSETTISPGCKSPTPNPTSSIDILRARINTIQKTTDEFYAVLQDPESVSHTQILKYFEQIRGVLVMNVEWVEGLEVQCICMTSPQLEELSRHYSSGSLATDLETLLTTPDLLSGLGLSGIKLDTCISREHLSLAETELSHR